MACSFTLSASPATIICGYVLKDGLQYQQFLDKNLKQFFECSQGVNNV